MTKSKLKFSLILNTEHEGEVCGITQETISDTIRSSITTLIKDEMDDEDNEVKMSIYFNEFEYSDNLDSMRSIIAESITTLDADSLTQLLEIINHG